MRNNDLEMTHKQKQLCVSDEWRMMNDGKYDTLKKRKKNTKEKRYLLYL